MKPSGLGSTQEIPGREEGGVCMVIRPRTSTLALIHRCLHWPELRKTACLRKDLLCARYTCMTAHSQRALGMTTSPSGRPTGPLGEIERSTFFQGPAGWYQAVQLREPSRGWFCLHSCSWHLPLLRTQPESEGELRGIYKSELLGKAQERGQVILAGVRNRGRKTLLRRWP